MNCSKNFHSSLDVVNSASKHSVVQHCTAGVCKQSKHYIYIYNYSPSRSKTPSSLRPLHLYFYLGQNLVPILSANCLAFGKDFKTSNTWSWALYYFLDTVKDFKQVAPLVLSLYFFSLWTNERSSAVIWTWSLFYFVFWTNRWDFSTRLLVPVPLFWLMMESSFFSQLLECQHNMGILCL